MDLHDMDHTYIIIGMDLLISQWPKENAERKRQGAQHLIPGTLRNLTAFHWAPPPKGSTASL